MYRSACAGVNVPVAGYVRAMSKVRMAHEKLARHSLISEA